LAASPIDAGDRLALRVSPIVSFAPADVVVRATVEADAANRAVEVVAESANFYRASEIQLDGERAAKTNRFEFRSLPPGVYSIRATLLDGEGHSRAHVRQELSVMASGGR
jgi:hypothetical protein